jgi:hypothetical protein
MTDGFALRGRAVISWRAAAASALLALALALGLWQGLDRATASAPAEVLRGLPLQRQGQLSATLGAATSSYRVRAVAAGFLRTSNPAQHVDALFGRGVEVHAGATTVGLSLRQAGYAGALRDVPAVAPKMSANRVLYAHPGIAEWYVNGPQGIEQGFTLARAPSPPAGGPLTLALALSGDARARLVPGGGEVAFGHPGGPSLRYGQLSASDASGRRLTSRMRLQDGRLSIEVDAHGARYPVTIDPLVQTPPKLRGAAEVGKGLFGFAVALSADGNTALIGGPNDDNRVGAAWVATRVNGAWAAQQKLVPAEEGGSACEAKEPGEEECGFGHSVALSADGSVAVVGAPRAGEQSGSAWVFVREGSAWRHVQTLSANEPLGKEARFGRSVAISADGSTVLVGAPNDHEAGSVWTFVRAGAEWVPFGGGLRLGGEELAPGHFGVSLALSGDGSTALIGEPGDGGYTGAAWAFVRGEGGWVRQGPRLRGAGELGERFGVSVALAENGDTALIGARGASGMSGAAWVFARSAESWSQQQRLLPGEAGGEAQFGSAVALSADGDAALVGAPHDSSSLGAAWQFARSGSSWSVRGGKLTGGAEESGKGSLGASVALRADGESALVGAPTDNVKVGSAWAFTDQLLLPQVTGVRPSAGPAAGGTTVTIEGERLSDVTEVRFGSVPASSFHVESDTAIAAVSPPQGVAGPVHVTVVGGEGPSPEGPRDLFTYIPAPTVTRLLPNHGSTAGGMSVEILGKGLTGASAVRFGSVASSSFVVHSDESISAIAPAEAAGSVPVTVTTPNGTSGEGPRFTFLDEAAESVSSATSTGSIGVLGFGPQGPGVRCAVALVSHVIAVSHSRAAVRLRWGGPGTCGGRVKLTVHVSAGRRRVRTRTIGTAIFSVRGGRIAIASVKLNALGRRLFVAAHGSLRASLTIVTEVPGPTERASGVVRLRLQRSRPPQRKR